MLSSRIRSTVIVLAGSLGWTSGACRQEPADDSPGSEANDGTGEFDDDESGTGDGTGSSDDGGTAEDDSGTGSQDDSTEGGSTEDSDDEGGSDVADTGSGSSGTDDVGDDGSGSDGGDTGTDTDSDVCDTADEGQSVTLTCPVGEVIEEIDFASYGDPTGTCGDFSNGTCDSEWSVAVVEALCLGRNTCTVRATNGQFEDPCSGAAKRLYVAASCGQGGNTGTIPFKGVANSSCANRMSLNVSWYYNWMQNETEACRGVVGGEFIPMIWGHPGNEQDATAIANSVAGFVEVGHEHVLGFNEPDNPSQSNIAVPAAIELWPSFDNPDILVGSPATAANANPGQAWFSDFMTELDNNSLRADFLAIHWYGWNAGSCDPDAAQLESYIEWVESFPGERPIWITEWGCLNQSAPDEQTVIDFYLGALAVFARHPRIERYAWYPWATNCGLNQDDGSLTGLGEAYSQAPAYK